MIIIGSDHAGFAMKEIIKEYLSGLNYAVEDIGMFSEDYWLPVFCYIYWQ